MSLYIHQLKDLTPKSADIESTFIIREIKKQTPPPLSYPKIFDYFSLFFVSESEKNAMANALDHLEPTIGAIHRLASLKDNVHEPINLKRAVEMLEEIPEPLALNLSFAKSISLWQEEFTQDFADLMNRLAGIGRASQQEKIEVNNQLNAIFNRLLRNDHIAFNFKDIVYEAQKNRITDLYESLEKGFFFKISLEDELKKLDFETRSRNIPESKLRAANEIKSMVRDIKKGVDAAYEVNLRMMNWGLIVYAYIKMMTSQK